MSEPNKANLFEILLDQIRLVVREEIARVYNENGHGALLTAEELAKALKVNKATIYERVKNNSIPCYHVGRFVRFSLHEVLESKRNKS